jgi:hypothetical protein
MKNKKKWRTCFIALSMTLSSRAEDYYDTLGTVRTASLGAGVLGFALLCGDWKDYRK